MARYALTIAGILHQKNTRVYHTDDKAWDKNISRACLYTPYQIEKIVSALHPDIKDNAVALYVIQNNNFNYHGKTGWVYDLAEANFYELREAEALVKSLSSA